MATFLEQDQAAVRRGKALLSADPRSFIPKVSALAAVLKSAKFDLEHLHSCQYQERRVKEA